MKVRELINAALGARRAQGAVVGINRRNVDLVYGHNRRKDYPTVDDKVLCKELLANGGVPIAPTIAVCDGLFDVDRVVEVLRGHDDFVIKPANGSKGEGILVVSRRDGDGWRTASGRFVSDDDIRQHLANVVFGAHSRTIEDRALVEQRIIPHPAFAAVYPGAVCDIRVILLEGEPLITMARVPTDRSGGRANLHQGGVGLAIDLETGVTTRAVIKGELVERHPDTGANLIGIQVPDWPAVLDVARRAAACVPLGYIGADLTLDANLGPLVLELNARPGLEIQNVTGIAIGDLLPAHLQPEGKG